MYSEIKSNNRILINRLDDSERILLQDICNNANSINSKVTMSPITGSTGDFDGVFLDIVPGEVTLLEVNTIPSNIELEVGQSTNVEITTNAPADLVKVLLSVTGKSINATYSNGNIVITPTDTQSAEENVIDYYIQAEGYTSVSGQIQVFMKPKENVTYAITFYHNDAMSNLQQDDCGLADDKDTMIEPVLDEKVSNYNNYDTAFKKTYTLVPGNYVAKAKAYNSSTWQTYNIEVTEDDLYKSEVTLELMWNSYNGLNIYTPETNN